MREEDGVAEAEVALTSLAAVKDGRDEQTLAQAAFTWMQHWTRFARWTGAEAIRQSAHEGLQFQALLASWADCYLVCRLTAGWDTQHSRRACPRDDSPVWVRIEEGRQEVEEAMFFQRRLAPFSGCFHCGLPQANCARWEAETGDEGTFRLASGGVCQYPRLPSLRGFPGVL